MMVVFLECTRAGCKGTDPSANERAGSAGSDDDTPVNSLLL